MANEATARVSQSVNFGAGTIGGVVASVTANLVTWFSQLLLASGTREIDLTVDKDAVKLAAMEASQDCTVQVNSTSSPAPEIELKANQPLIWRDGDPTALFLTADVTKIYVIVGAEDTVFKFGALVDSTP